MDEAMGSRKPPKRLRGWKMDKAKMDEPQEESQEDCDNPLCTRLIELWSQGHLSATQVAEICHLSMLSGCEHPQIVAGARYGCSLVQKDPYSRAPHGQSACEGSQDPKGRH